MIKFLKFHFIRKPVENETVWRIKIKSDKIVVNIVPNFKGNDNDAGVFWLYWGVFWWTDCGKGK